MQSVRTQLRYVTRRFVSTPLFTIVAVTTLAVGIGANSAIFSAVNGVLLKPLAFRDAERPEGVWHKAPALAFDVVNQGPALHFTYREATRVLEDIAKCE